MLTMAQKREIQEIALKQFWNTKKTEYITDLVSKVDEKTGNVIIRALVV